MPHETRSTTEASPGAAAVASNRALVFSEIVRSPGASRQRVAAQLGLVPATVGTHVRTLVKHGFVREDAPRAATGGRPSIPLRARQDTGVLLGVSIERGSVVGAAVSASGDVLHTCTVPIEMDDPIASTVTATERLQEGLGGRPVAAVGVTVSGVVDTSDGTVAISTVLDWHEYPLGRELRKLLPFPVFVENDVIALAQRELAFAPSVPDSFLLLHISDGVGMAIVTGRSIVRGVRHGSIEFGHISLDPDGELCRCGNRGCMQTVFGYSELRAASGQSSAEWAELNLSAPTVRLVEERAQILGRGVGSISTLLGIDHIRVSGRTAQHWDAFGASMTDAIVRSTPTLGVAPVIDVVTWSESGIAQGAAGVALNGYLETLR